AEDTFFLDQVWTKVGARSCLKCHKAGGDAEDSEFVLKDPSRESGNAMEQNRTAFTWMAKLREKDQWRLLLKATGGLDHGGEEVFKPESTGYRILEEFVRRTNG